MGSELTKAEIGLAFILPCYFKDLIISINKITEGKTILNSEDIRDIVSNLVKFYMSDEYFFLQLALDEIKSEKYMKPEYSRKANDFHSIVLIFQILENFQKFLSIKCLFPLLEELKKSKFEEKINEFHLLIKNKNENIIKNFQNKLEKFQIFSEEFKKTEDYQKIFALLNNKNNKEYEKASKIIFIYLSYLFESEIEGKYKINKKELIAIFFGGLDFFISLIKKLNEKKELNQLLKDLLSFNYPLKYTNEIYQLFIAALNIIILAFDDSQIEKNIIIYHEYFNCYPVFLGIKNNIKDKKTLEIKDIITDLKEFYMSDKFILSSLTLKNITEIKFLFFFHFFIIFKNIKKNLSINCLFPLLEELKKAKFENQINNIIKIIKNEDEKKNFIKLYNDKAQEVVNYDIEFKNFLEKNNFLIKEDEKKEKFFKIIPEIFSTFFQFEEKGSEGHLDKENLVDLFFQNINEYYKNFNDSSNIKILINELMKLNFSLDITKEIYQLFICGLNIILSYEKIKDKFDKDNIKQLKGIIEQNSLSENNIYIIFETHNILFYTKKKVEENEISILFFEKIENKKKNKNKIIYKNLFNGDEISEEQFKKLVKNEIKEDKIIDNENEIEIKDDKIMINENEIKEDKDDTLLKKLNEERNKNKELEKELSEKNNRIEILENENKKLKEELNNQININNNSKEEEEKKKLLKENFDTKDEAFKSMLEKDKEIKELKEKIKRLPFELNENEKLISVIFTNSKKEFYYSLICKNTERFSAIENKLYDKFPQFGETANYFLVDGKKIIPHKTLEDNHIKDSSIIILNQIQI